MAAAAAAAAIDAPRILGAGTLKNPYGVAFVGAGRIVVADGGNHRVVVFDPATGAVVRTLGRGPGSGAGELNSPVGVAVVGAGRIAVADFNNHRVVVFDAATGAVVETLGRGPGSGAGELNNPYGVAFVGAGRIAVADYNNHRVVVFDAATGAVVETLGCGPGSGAGELNNPWGVAVDGAGRIAVADRGNHRVVVFDAATCAVVQTLGRGPGSGAGELNNPWGVAVDDAGGLVVADGSNHRVQVFAGAVAGGAVGVVGLPAAVRPLLAGHAPAVRQRVLADARVQAPLRVFCDVAPTLHRLEEVREELRRLEEGDPEGRQRAAVAEFEGAWAAVLGAEQLAAGLGAAQVTGQVESDLAAWLRSIGVADESLAHVMGHLEKPEYRVYSLKILFALNGEDVDEILQGLPLGERRLIKKAIDVEQFDPDRGVR